MAKVIINGDTSGSITLDAPAVAGTTTITLPATTGTAVVTTGNQTVEFADGSASAPSITNSGDNNTGIFFPAADTIAFSEGGVESMRINSSGNVGIGTSSPAGAAGRNLTIYNSSGQSRLALKNSVTGDGANDGFQVGIDGDGEALLDQRENLPLRFSTNATERMRIDSSGTLFIGKTSTANDITTAGFFFRPFGKMVATTADSGEQNFVSAHTSATGTVTAMQFFYNSTSVGTIQKTSTATSYNTSSDYRLKENIAPMTGALDKVAQLKPVTYKWKVDGSDGQGFIAHELQAVVPDCVTGEKDAVDEEGNPKYQGVDTSFLVATLTAAIQEQQQIINNLKARIETLEGAK